MANFKKALTMCFGFETWASEQKTQVVPMSYGVVFWIQLTENNNFLTGFKLMLKATALPRVLEPMPHFKICLLTIATPEQMS